MPSIIPIGALQDNYIWMFYDTTIQKAWVVDPGEASPVIQQLKVENLSLAGILLTHHHRDHSGGIADLLSYAGDIPVYGSHNSPVSTINRRVSDHDQIQCGDLNFQIIAIPGHTLDHLAYYADPVLFCGDTLFSVGCGKIFEGTAAQMYESLSKLMRLPDHTQIYCGHEYTLSNLQFAKVVEPHNHSIQQKILLVNSITQNQGCTLPALLDEEKLMNPFLRCTQPEVIQLVSQYCGKAISSPIDIFTELRHWKNNFKG